MIFERAEIDEHVFLKEAKDMIFAQILHSSTPYVLKD